MQSNYTSIRKFGDKAKGNDPLTYCLVDTMDKNFYNVIGNLYGPRSDRCQAYMAQRCADNYDGFCEYYVQEHQYKDEGWPINVPAPNTEQNNIFGATYNQPASLGDQLLQNASARKYCEYVNCHKRCEPFDPMNPNSPQITFYESNGQVGQGCVPLCRVDPSKVDNDPLMNRMLSKPSVVAPTLINICNTAKRDGTDLSGTKVGRFCQRYHENMEQMNRR